jgi:SAM-dependent methyltransferase
MKIVLAQYWTENVGYGKYVEAVNRKYCEDKGYTYYLETDTKKIYDAIEGRAPTWYKPKFILEVMEKENPDYVLFLDADAMVCDFSYDIESFIIPYREIVCTEDYGPSKLNAGVFLMKNSLWTKEYLKNWWDICDELEGGPDNIKGYYAQALWHDQTCFGVLMESTPRAEDLIKIISPEVLNGREYRSSHHKNFIFHAFSYGNVKNRTLDLAYYDMLNIPKPEGLELLDIAPYYATDKHYEHHYFDLVYSDLFKPLCKEVKKFIEVGVNNGDSILLWRDYFKSAEVTGYDIATDYCMNKLEGKDLTRVKIEYLDQSDENQLDTLVSTLSDIDVVMDDGSHRMRDQQITFAKLFKTLRPGGIYVLEDLHTSLEVVNPEKAVFGWGDPTKTITMNMLEEFKSTGKMSSFYMTGEEMEYLENNIESVEIYRSRPDWSITSVIRKKA